MQVNGINKNYMSASPYFGVKIPQNIKNKVLTEAVEYGTEGLNRAKTQIEKVKAWGHRDSELSAAFDIHDNEVGLGLFNISFSKNYGAGFTNKNDNFYDTFMSLKEKDIQDAEKQIKDAVENSKLDLIAKACESAKIRKKITGIENPTTEDLAAAIDKLSEDEIVKIRFNLDETSKFSTEPPLNFGI